MMTFDAPDKKELFETLWEKEKMLVNTLFSNLSKTNSRFEIAFGFSSAKYFGFEQGKNLVWVEAVGHSILIRKQQRQYNIEWSETNPCLQ